MSETTGAHTLSHPKAFRLEATGKKRPGVHSKVINPDEENQGEVSYILNYKSWTKVMPTVQYF